MASDCSVIISSFDGFKDVWIPFCKLFEKYWADCPFDIFAITNYNKFPSNNIKTLMVGKDCGWSNNIVTALKNINTRYILYMQEDYLLTDYVNTHRILMLFKKMKELKASYLRLIPIPPPDNKIDEYVGYINHKSKYVTSLQCSFWDKNVILDLIKPNETAWDMEIRGTKRVAGTGYKFLCTLSSSMDYIFTGIIRGLWNKKALELLLNEGIDVDIKRGIAT